MSVCLSSPAVVLSSRSPPAASVLASVPFTGLQTLLFSYLCALLRCPPAGARSCFGNPHPGAPELKARFSLLLSFVICAPALASCGLQALRPITHAIFQYGVLYMALARLCVVLLAACCVRCCVCIYSAPRSAIASTNILSPHSLSMVCRRLPLPCCCALQSHHFFFAFVPWYIVSGLIVVFRRLVAAPFDAALCWCVASSIPRCCVPLRSCPVVSLAGPACRSWRLPPIKKASAQCRNVRFGAAPDGRDGFQKLAGYELPWPHGDRWSVVLYPGREPPSRRAACALGSAWSA
jgi:hypothetical protein